MSTLRFKMGMAEAENASLRGRIRTIEAIETVTRNQERRTHREMERQLASVQESQGQDQENFRKLHELVMDAPTIPVSAKENLGDPIDIRVDIIHLEPVAAVAFPTAAVVRTQAQHGEAIRGILEHLQGVPIEEEMSTLRFRMGMAKAKNASLRGKIKTMEAIETVTRS
ncbi:hypothetical protein Tco_0554105 [Tanacetum coccineum]